VEKKNEKKEKYVFILSQFHPKHDEVIGKTILMISATTIEEAKHKVNTEYVSPCCCIESIQKIDGDADFRYTVYKSSMMIKEV